VEHEGVSDVAVEKSEARALPTEGRSARDPAATVLRLQRTIGNRGVGRFLDARRTVARQPMPTAPPAAVSAAPAILSKEDKVRLASATASRINQAFTAFTAAVQRHQKRLESEAKVEAELVAATVDIFFGLAAPIFAAGMIAKAGGVAGIAKRVSDLTSSADVAGKMTPFLSQTDFLKESFKGVGKYGTTAIKLNASTLFGETEADSFATQLRVQFHHGVQAMTDKLTLEPEKLTDQEVIAAFLAYHADFTDENAYVDALKQTFAGFDKWVKPIAVSQGGPMVRDDGTEVQAVWLDAYGRRRLALVRDSREAPGFLGGGFPRLVTRFVGWVPKDMEPHVIAKTTRQKGMVTLSDPGTITGHIPAPVD
jgi:hypothetical protein